MKAKMYVLHSPYPDKTWRGIEKCLGNPEYDAISPGKNTIFLG